ncbi:proto-oncogene tyrosine-protein kinase receptor Ret isoform X2 [Daktulosphaira vitifoliae]|nr:proto-oncogene tyrosine-protein kinase receptor Ret isoform X2 [Daktulosphaira vitifoliae]
MTHCADINKDTKSSCMSSCGIGSPLKCQWRESPNPDVLSVNYSTCTPDMNTCPDGFCDTLERKNLLICPQDCTEDVFGTGMMKGKRGIYTATGVCTCDDIGKCTCEKKTKGVFKSKKIIPEYKYNNTPLTTGIDLCYNNWCDRSIIISAIILILFVTTGIILYFCRSRFSSIFHSKKLNRNMRDLGGLIPNRDLGDYQHSPGNRDTSFINMEFDPKWEFPRSRLIVEQIIGEGEFGKVLRAQAIDIFDKKGISTVAVKTVKNGSDKTEKDDLLSEYNLLKEVNHPNVVKLLGACTTHDGPFYLIIEYAKYGSLRSYLRKSRIIDKSFDGITSQTGEILQNEIRQSFALPLHPITPRDILKFAWQISKGMTYLAEIKLVHRDLAARNVLIAEGKVCKISDFGLTRDVYEDNAYLKKTKGRVPVKWMAPESLSDHIYTSRSDVWSFGILLWELVTLGSVPYPGIIVHDLFKLLKEGYRMEKPNNCSDELYEIMLSCWAQDQYRRPSFKSLTLTLEKMLENGNDYLQLDFKPFVNNMYYFMKDDDLELNKKICIQNENIDDQMYETPKEIKEIGLPYLTMKDFVFEPQLNTQIV